MRPLVWLLVLPLLAGPAIYFLGRVTARVRPQRLEAVVSLSSLAAMLALWLPFVMLARTQLDSGPVELSVGAILLRFDGLSLLLTAVVLALGTLVVLYSGPQMAHRQGDEKYFASLVIMIGMIIGLGCAGDLFNLWVWFEGMAVASYLLVVFYRTRPTALEAGVKYLVQSMVGSVLILLAIAMVFADAGQLDLGQIRTVALSRAGMLAAGALFTVGFGVKAALVPMHTWLPDAHAEAPSGVSAMLSGVVIEAGLIALLRVLMALSGTGQDWGLLLLAFGALNMIAGNLLALRQTQVKRMLAYSSLSHMGYILLGLGIGVYAGQVAGAAGGLFHLFNHGLMKGLAFLAAGAFIYALEAGRPAGAEHGLAISDLAGAAQRYPLTTAALSLALLGLGGIPPLAGFMSEWQIFVAGFAVHSAAISGLVIFAALNSLLSLAYYVPVINVAYRAHPSAAVTDGRALPWAVRLSMVALSGAMIAVGVWPRLVLWLIEPAGQAVLAGFGL